MQTKQGKLIIIVMVMLILLAVLSIFFIVNLSGIYDFFNKPDITKKYDEKYATDGKFVYYHDSGYKKVEGADPTTFISLGKVTGDGKKIYSYQNFIAGKDKNNVFVKTNKITQLDPNTVYLLGNNYLTDGVNIYFEDIHIKNADIKTFAIIWNFYAKDQNKIYYKGQPLEDSDPNSWQFVYDEQDRTIQVNTSQAERLLGVKANNFGRKSNFYFKDANQVYYKDKVIVGADPNTFHPVDVEGDQWSFHYAKDENYYYFRGEMLPDHAEGWDGVIPAGGLQLLQADKNFGWAEIFYYGKDVFVFDTEQLKLIHFFTRSTDAPFVEIARGVYKDDLNVYFAASRENWVRVGRNGKRLAGRYTLLQPLDNVRPEDFQKVGEITGKPNRKQAEIFAANGIKYYHPRFVDRGSALVYYVPDNSGLKPEDYSDKALELHLKNPDVREPLGLQQIKWQDKYTYYTDYQNFFERHMGKLFWGFFILVAVLSSVIKRYSKK